MLTPYSKPALTVPALLALLKERGLHIEYDFKAKSYLKNIGYFRLSAYFYPLLQIPKSDHQYKQGTSFSQVMHLYRFDKKLRLLLFNEIEKIEVAIRSVVIGEASLALSDSFWMTNSTHFFSDSYFQTALTEINSELKKSKEEFVIHFKETYSDAYPPSWMVAEILSLGTLCRIYKNINSKPIKKSIALQFGLQPKAFESWIMAIAGLRNICCHHGRLWNRTLVINPALPQHTTHAWIANPEKIDIQRVYFRLCMVKYLLTSISPSSDFKEKFKRLLSEYPLIDIQAMGFPLDWESEPLWR